MLRRSSKELHVSQYQAVLGLAAGSGVVDPEILVGLAPLITISGVPAVPDPKYVSFQERVPKSCAFLNIT